MSAASPIFGRPNMNKIPAKIAKVTMWPKLSTLPAKSVPNSMARKIVAASLKFTAKYPMAATHINPAMMPRIVLFSMSMASSENFMKNPDNA